MSFFQLDYPQKTRMFEKSGFYKDIIQYEPRKELGFKLNLLIILGAFTDEFRVSYSRFNEQEKPIERINRSFEKEEEAKNYLQQVFDEFEEYYKIKLMLKEEEGDLA